MIGITFEPGLRRFLNEMVFLDKYKDNLHTTYKSYLRYEIVSLVIFKNMTIAKSSRALD